MLIRFTVENFLSFNERVDFNMIASPDTKHPHHVVKDENDPESIGVLKTSLIYGANASGKSNLVKAMDFAQRLIVDGVDKNENIPIARFKLDKDCSTKPSRFEFEFKHKGKQYAYGFVVDESSVREEWLFEIGITLEETVFTRQLPKDYYFNYDHELISEISQDEKDRLQYEATGTRDNLLFLTNYKERDVVFLENIYKWFKNSLIIIKPYAKPFALPLIIQSETKAFDNILQVFDLGIEKIAPEEIELDNIKDNSLKETIKKIFPFDDEETQGFFISRTNRIIKRKKEESGITNILSMIQINTIKKDKNGDLVPFEISEESDGTQRIIDLIPMLIMLNKRKVVCVIDEIERSLHPLLTQKLFDFFLESSNDSQGQLIATTHDTHLLNNNFRKDEIWFAEKDKHGQSICYSLANTKVDNLDLEKGYINGRFGAIPFINIKDIKVLDWTQENNQDA